MATTVQNVKISEYASFFPIVAHKKSASREKVYDRNKQRIYALSFWMTDNELAAEELTQIAFQRAFALHDNPTEEQIDHALLTEVRELMPIGLLTLDCAGAQEVMNVRRNTKRVHLERAVVQLPATERLIFLMHDGEGYDHSRIARALGVTEEESKFGLHQARLRVRELVASMS